LLPTHAQVSIMIPENKKVSSVRLLMADTTPAFQNKSGKILLSIQKIEDHEIIAIDLT
jgi:hypothetical protein